MDELTALKNRKGKLLNRKNLLILAGIILIGLVVGLNIYRANQKEVVKVKTAAVGQKKLVQTVLASGKVATAQKEVIFSQATGTVKKIHVLLGQKVEPGQVLLELDIPDAEQRTMQARAAVATAEANLERARASGKSMEIIEAETTFGQAQSDYELASEKLRRYQTLWATGAIAKEQLEAVQADYSNAKRRYEKAQAALKAAQAADKSHLAGLEATLQGARAGLAMAERQNKSGLVASISGQIMSIGVQEGDLIMANTPLVTVGNIDSLEVRADISEADVTHVKVGQKVLIVATAMPDHKYQGQVREIGLEAVVKQKSQSETSGVQVIIEVEKETLLRPGFNVDLEITTAIDKNALVVPFEAVVEKKGLPHVYVVRDKMAHLQKITTGINDNLRVQVRSGLKKGDQVVLNPPPALKDGSLVKIK